MGCMSFLGMVLAGALAVSATPASSSPAAKNDDPAKPTGQSQAGKEGGPDRKVQNVPASTDSAKSEGDQSGPKDHSQQSGPKDEGVGSGDSADPDKSKNKGAQLSPEGHSQQNGHQTQGPESDADGPQPSGEEQTPSGSQPGAGGGGAGTGETAGVQTCQQPGTSITLQIPEKGSSAQFACKSGFTLYPELRNKIFAKDCKKQETLKDMTRTETPASTPPSADGAAGPSGGGDVTTSTPAPGPTSGAVTALAALEPTTGASPPVVYTLKADNKPPRKTYCYLCAEQGISEVKPGTADKYCIIYVESGARAHPGVGLTFALVLPCVLAVL